MYLNLAEFNKTPSPLENFVIKRATDQKSLKDFAFVLGNDSNVLDPYFEELATLLTHEDPYEYYVGYLDNIPINCGLLCFYGRVAGLHCLTTSPQSRKQGYGTRLQIFRLNRAKELGYQTAVLQASESGYPLYLKLDWKPIEKIMKFKRCAVY